MICIILFMRKIHILHGMFKFTYNFKQLFQTQSLRISDIRFVIEKTVLIYY